MRFSRFLRFPERIVAQLLPNNLVHQRTIMALQPLRLTSVIGFNGRVNDVIFLPSVTSTMPAEEKPSDVIIFFGGDVQDYPENMTSHRDHGIYVEYNLESVACMLAKKFPVSPILVVRPARIQLKTFSCYSNFVHCNDIGSPTHQENCEALLHLSLLLQSVSGRTGSLQVGQSDAPLTLIGFSKGCVVLNQFLYSFNHLRGSFADSAVKEFAQRIRKMVWLDGGHSGGKDTWVSSSPILSSFAEKGISVDIHVTPYQVKDAHRPWIGKEEKQFHTTLKKLGVPLSRKTYFEEESPSLENHFALLKEFTVNNS